MDREALINLFVNWLPMLLIIGVWIYFMKKGGGLGYGKYLEEHLAENKRQNELMLKLLEKMDERIARLEDTSRRQGRDT
jgi:cell division protease FtsH